MAVLKLSQIAAAGSAPAASDQAVGVTTGNTDNLFSFTQVNATVLNTIGMAVGSAKITGGTTNRLMYDNAGVVGEATVAGSLTFSGGILSVTAGGIASPTTSVQFNNGGQFGGDSGFTYAGTGQATLALGTITSNAIALNITGTWNAAGVTFDAPLFMNITNTASNSASRFIDIQSSSVSLFNLSQQFSGSELNRVTIGVPNSSSIYMGTGNLYFSGSSGGVASRTVAVSASSGGGSISFGAGSSIQTYYGNADIPAGTLNTTIWSDGAGSASTSAVAISALTGSTGAAFRVYNTTDQQGTVTPPTNYERGVFDWTTTSNVLTIGMQKGGTGSRRTIFIDANVGLLLGSQNTGYFNWDVGSGCFAITSGSGNFFGYSSSASFGLTGGVPANVDTAFYRDAAVGAFAIANFASKTTATALRVYNTTDQVGSNTAPTNYERGVFDWTTTSNVLTIGTQAGGTGTQRNINIVSPTGSSQGTAFIGGNFIFSKSTASFGSDATTPTQLIVDPTGSGGCILTVLNNSGQNVVAQNFAFGAFPTGLLITGNAGQYWNANSGGFGGAWDTGFNRVAANVIQANSGSAGATGWVQWLGELRTASATNYTNNTPTTIMSIALAAGRTYSFDGYIPVTAGGNAGGVQVVLNASGGLTATAIQADSVAFSNNVNVGQVSVSTITTLTSVVLGAATGYVEFHGTITVNAAGTLNFQTAQSATNATQMTIGRGARVFLYDMP